MARADVDDEQFPAGLRVLVVDDDVTCLTVLKTMLLKCRYAVTVCAQAATALALLRESKDGFHVVLSDVHMPDMDGFRLLELVGLEMDLPVIMMSADARTNVVMKGIKHGACDYLIKPVRMEELKNIWQHVIRKKHTDSTRDLELSGSFDDSDRPTPNQNNTINNNNNNSEIISNSKRAVEQEGESVNEAGSGELRMREKKKRCVVKEEEEGETDSGDPNCSSKKPRVVWSVELHQQFVNAVNQLGIDKAVPKRILELMNVPGLTRENVASHLQKFRLYLKRLSGVAHHHPGLQNPFCGPISSNIKPSPLGRLDFETLVASGQIPPQTLAALEEELLSQSSPKPHNSIREIAFGQPLMNCGPHSSSLSRQFPQSGNMNPGSVNPGFEIPGSGFPTWPGNNDLTQIIQQQQHQQNASRSVQPSCLVIPSSSQQSQLNNFQLGDNNNNNNNPLLLGQSQSQQSCLVRQSPMILPSQSLTSLQGLGPASQNLQMSQVGGSVITAQPSISGNSSYANSGSGSNSVVDYNNMNNNININNNIMRSKNLRFGVGQIVDDGLKNMAPGLNNFNNIINSSNHNNIGSNNNNGYNFGMPGIMSGMSRSGSGAFLPDNNMNNNNNNNMNNNNNNNMRRNNLLGFVGKGTCIPSRFAVDEIESPTNIPNFGQISGGDLVNLDPFGLDGQI